MSLSTLKFLKDKYKDQIEIQIYNIIGELPHFNPNLENKLPEEV